MTPKKDEYMRGYGDGFRDARSEGRYFWLHYDHQAGKWCVENEPPKVIRTGSEIIHAREVTHSKATS